MAKRSTQQPQPEKPSPIIDVERAFWREHREELKKRYPEQWVAARRTTGEVVAVAPSFSAVLREAKQAGFEHTEIWCSKLLTEPVHLIV